MSGPSEKAVQAATAALYDEPHTDTERAYARDVLAAAHDPALGLDRSVCLRDVVEALGRFHAPVPARSCAAFIERELGGGS